MNRIFMTITIGLLAQELGAAAAAKAAELVPVSVQQAFIPVGFDDNDEVEVVLDGQLPNGCYRIATPRQRLDPVTNTIEVTAMAFYYPGDCDPFVVPFTISANVGVLAATDYVVKVGGVAPMALTVKHSTSVGPDDFLYASVDQVSIEVIPERRSIIAYITGRFTNSCMGWDRVELTDSGETLELLPIIQMRAGSDCHAVDVHYKGVKVALPWRKMGRYLLHVRTMSGKSANNVFSVYGEG